MGWFATTETVGLAKSSTNKELADRSCILLGLSQNLHRALQAEEQVGRMSWELEGDTAALCQDLLFWPDDHQNLCQV